jgi:hypothetical protein
LPVSPELLDEIDALCPLEDRSSERRVLGLSDGTVRDGLALACRNDGLASLWLAHGFETVFVKQGSGHSKASKLSDV